MAFSFVLLICAGLMMRSLYNLLSIDPEFKSANVLSMNVNLNWTRYAELSVQNTFFRQILDRAQQIPGTETVALSSIVPLNRDSGGMNAGILFEGRALPPGEPLPRVDYELATLDYFHVDGAVPFGYRQAHDFASFVGQALHGRAGLFAQAHTTQGDGAQFGQ